MMVSNSLRQEAGLTGPAVGAAAWFRQRGVLGGLLGTAALSIVLASVPVNSASADRGDNGRGARVLNCGDDLNEAGNYRVDSDLVCTAPIRVNASHVHVDLRGHSITCDTDEAWQAPAEYPWVDAFAVNYDSYVAWRGGADPEGLAVITDFQIRNGTIANCLDGMFWYKTDRSKASDLDLVGHNRDNEALNSFARGINLEASHNNKIRRNRFSGNSQGIVLHLSNGNDISHNLAELSGDTGFMLFGATGNVFAHNRALNNGWGFWVDAGNNGENSTGNTLKDNEASGNSEDGLALIGSADDNVLRKNTASNNGGIGILMVGVPEFGIAVPAGNSITNNTAIGNGAIDVAEVEILDFFGAFEIVAPDECANLWNGNTFDTELRPLDCEE